MLDTLELLTKAVRASTGLADAEPRPGQRTLLADIDHTLDEAGSHLVGIAPTGVGKALDLDTPIPTPDGWTTMGEIKVGDIVFDQDGGQTRVVGVSPVQTGRRCYEVLFSDGSAIVADGEHLWASWTRSTRSRMSAYRTKHNRHRGLGSIDQLRETRRSIDRQPQMTTADFVSRFPSVLTTRLIAQKRRNLGLSPAGGGVIDMRPILDAFIEQRTSTNGDYELVTTDRMRETITAQGGLNHAITVTGALECPERVLPIDPYVLGAWLGDGSSWDGSITTGQDDVDDLVALLASRWPGQVRRRPDKAGRAAVVRMAATDETLCPWGHRERRRVARQTVCATCWPWVKSSADRRTSSESRWNVGLTARLRQAGLIRNKHVPGDYLRASTEQRLALLQGLMDTDGTSVRRRWYEFCVVNERLASDVLELLLSLGIKATLRESAAGFTRPDGSWRECGTRYRIAFTTGLPMFRLPRKIAAQEAFSEKEKDSRTQYRYVTEVREVHSRPVRCIVVGADSHLFLAGNAMIPTHNSLSYLVPAAVQAMQGSRTLISTESLGLQHQVVEKDFPAVAVAVGQMCDLPAPSVAVLKGWSNYACLRAAGDSVFNAAGVESPDNPQAYLDQACTLAARQGDALAVWCLDPENETGDRAKYTGSLAERDWDRVSVTPDACLNDECPLLEYCYPRQARSQAASAQVVVTNHSMLAVQAAKAVPVVIGSKALGDFDQVVVDEAHALPGIVRGMGSVEVHAGRIAGAIRSLSRVLDGSDARVRSAITEAEALTDKLSSQLASSAQHLGGDASRVPEDYDPLSGCGDDLLAWCSGAVRMISTATRRLAPSQRLPALKAMSRISSLAADIKEVRVGDIGLARWYEVTPDGRAAVCASPVDVGAMLHGQVWTAPVITDDQDPDEPSDPLEGATNAWDGQRRELSVVALSATLPKGFGSEAGLRGRAVEYPSPFADAYAGSALFVPDADAPGWPVPSRTFGRKQSLDTREHPRWALDSMKALIEAAGGHALVLSATRAAGELYARELSQHARGRWRVLNQWSGESKQATVGRWRQEDSSVLVGTRSYMTGVDAPGRTCSLVIIDRVPRAAGNVVDDARAQVLAQNMNDFTARELIYGGDAAQLLAQAAGRLVRSTADRGVVAVLDPRLLRRQPFSYNESTRRLYMGALSAFPSVSKMTSLQQVCQYLGEMSETYKEAA